LHNNTPQHTTHTQQEKTGKKAMVDAFLAQTAAQVTKNFASDAKLKKAAVDQVRACIGQLGSWVGFFAFP
jgi:hypothetical protein